MQVVHLVMITNKSDLESSEDNSNKFDEPLLLLEDMQEAIQDEMVQEWI